jgi:hypothetical protein
VTRSAYPGARAGNTPHPTRHDRSSTVCPSRTSLTVTTREPTDRTTVVTSPRSCLRSRE